MFLPHKNPKVTWARVKSGKGHEKSPLLGGGVILGSVQLVTLYDQLLSLFCDVLRMGDCRMERLQLNAANRNMPKVALLLLAGLSLLGLAHGNPDKGCPFGSTYSIATDKCYAAFCQSNATCHVFGPYATCDLKTKWCICLHPNKINFDHLCQAPPNIILAYLGWGALGLGILSAFAYLVYYLKFTSKPKATPNPPPTVVYLLDLA